MKKISTVFMRDFKTGESLEFSNNLIRVYAAVDTKSLMLEDPLSAFKSAAADLENVFIDSTGNEMTRELQNLDKLRLTALSSVNWLLRSQEKGSTTETAAMAARLNNNYKQHCKGIFQQGYQNKTALIRSMLKD
ncbi:MAG: hypothetical protein IPN97_06850 [Saprospiraceae bacterium]|nr:hypothetical protein [Saprospiraceae bacterium]